ncbi:MAG TPA: conjugative transposon protein TraM [Cyclobacteriaceae bacterium]|nr:conjugative transposon protein TraM [Cyclobacteriaceae bacterium]
MALQKHQIGIVASLGGLVLIAVVYGIFAFSSQSKSEDTFETRQAASTRLPTVPVAPTEEFSSKLEQTQDELDRRKKAELEGNNKREIDLDIFKDRADPPMVVTEQTPAPSPIQIKRPSSNTTSTSRKKDSEPPTVDDENQIDPDLKFASGNSRLNKGEVEQTVADKKETFELHAVVHDQVTVTQGTRITLRTTKDFTYQGKTIPANTFLPAIVTFNNLRVILSIPPVPFADGTLYQDKLNAYDGNDLVAGLYAKELLENKGSQNTAGEIIDQSSGDVPSQAARSAIRNLARGKVREQSVVLRSNHPVIIKK